MPWFGTNSIGQSYNLSDFIWKNVLVTRLVRKRSQSEDWSRLWVICSDRLWVNMYSISNCSSVWFKNSLLPQFDVKTTFFNGEEDIYLKKWQSVIRMTNTNYNIKINLLFETSFVSIINLINFWNISILVLALLTHIFIAVLLIMFLFL